MALEFYGLRKFAAEKRRTGRLLRVGIPMPLQQKLGWQAGDYIEVWGDVEKGAVVLRLARQLERKAKDKGAGHG